MKLIMHDSEIDLYKKYLHISSSYFEYGCGGSTVLASSYSNITSIVSIDSSLEWIEKVKGAINPFNNIEFIYCDINGNPKNWGHPEDKSKIDNWIQYPRSILQKNKTFDLILVDGRFRIACCAAAAMRMSSSSILLLHDCERYKNIPLKQIDQAQSLAVYIKDSFSNEELLEIIEKNKHKTE